MPPLYSPMSDDDSSGPTPHPSSSAVVFTPQGPMLRFQDAVVEETVTRVKRTTTSFAPIPLPRVPEPDHLPLPTYLSAEDYPLAHEPIPDDMRFFAFDIDGQRVYVQDEGIDLAQGIPGQTVGPGWTREVPAFDKRRTMTVDGYLASQGNRQDKDKGKGKERKRPHEISRPSSSGGQYERERRPDVALQQMVVTRGRSPPRKKIRSGEGEFHNDDISDISTSSNRSTEERAITASHHPVMSSGLETLSLMSLPALADQFDKLPDKIQQHLLMHMLRRSRMPTIQRIAGFASKALCRDFITLLPHEVAVQILTQCDLKSLVAGMRVNKRWRRMIDSERSVWRARLHESGLAIGDGTEEAEEKSIRSRWDILDWQHRRSIRGRKLKAGTPSEDEPMLEAPRKSIPYQAPDDRPTPVKHIFRRRYTSKRNWLEHKPKHTTFPGHGISVVTCVQFDEDKIVSASDDLTINIYDTKTGVLRKRLDGHEGGVWALEYKGYTLVTGSTDRTVRIWDLKTLKPTHVFSGHSSTVRCLQIVEPVFDPATGEFQPAYPLIVTGSRDATLRVWRLPEHGESTYVPGTEPTPPESNPYHRQHLEGHTEAVRALAVHGRICVSGSYDKTVRVWDIVKGTVIHVLHGHEHKVYSIALDVGRNRCSSGAMDNTVRVWDIEAGVCLHTLSGHTSLVGLLSSSYNYIVSAAADASVRVWDAETCKLKHALTGHAAPITCFQHDENKIVSGSDGALKLWDIRTGKPVRDLIIGISSVWQVAFKDNLLVAASNRNGSTVFDVFDFGSQPDPYGVDNDRLDNFKRKPWERPNPHEPQTYQVDDMDMSGSDGDDVLSPKAETWRATNDAPQTSVAIKQEVKDEPGIDKREQKYSRRKAKIGGPGLVPRQGSRAADSRSDFSPTPTPAAASGSRSAPPASAAQPGLRVEELDTAIVAVKEEVMEEVMEIDDDDEA